MMRAFCVMVYTGKYQPSTEKIISKFENYRILVGPKDSVEFVKEHLKKEVKGDFKIIERFQEI